MYDKNSTTVTLSNSESTTLTVASDSNTADVFVLIGSGTTNTNDIFETPAQYTITTEINSGAGWFLLGTLENTTERSLTDPAIGDAIRYRITNTSGGEATYTIQVESR